MSGPAAAPGPRGAGARAPAAGVRVVVVNYRTPDLTLRAIRSLHAAYPELPIRLVDNGSGPECEPMFATLARDHAGAVDVVRHRRNLHHGPAMHLALTAMEEPLAWLLDSDCEVLSRGFLEAAAEHMGDPSAYAAGELMHTNHRGYWVERPGPGTVPYVHPACMLLRRAHYLALPPFERHGSPCLANMKAAGARGLGLVHVDPAPWVRHDAMGTAGRFGYGIGLRGRLNHLLNLLRL